MRGTVHARAVIAHANSKCYLYIRQSSGKNGSGDIRWASIQKIPLGLLILLKKIVSRNTL